MINLGSGQNKVKEQAYPAENIDSTATLNYTVE